MRRVIFLSTFSKSKLALMTLFWSVMFIADAVVICYSLFELFVREYVMGLILLVYGLIDIYGNWWHVCLAVEQINGQLTLPADASQQPTDQPASQPESRMSRRHAGLLKRMFGLGYRSPAEERMALRRQSLGIDPADAAAETDSTADHCPVADPYADPVHRSEIESAGQLESLNARRRAMAARHAASTASQAGAAAGSADSAQPAKHGYDLNQIPTIRLAAEPSPEERRVPGELAPDDWIDDDETDKIIQETLAKRQAAESQAGGESASADDIPADDNDNMTDEHAARHADSSADDDDIIPDDFDPNDDQAISKMIAQYDAEQSSRHAAESDAESDRSSASADD